MILLKKKKSIVFKIKEISLPPYMKINYNIRYNIKSSFFKYARKVNVESSTRILQNHISHLFSYG